MKVIVLFCLICATQAFPGEAPPVIKNFMQIASGDGSSNAAQIVNMQSISKNCGPGCDGSGTTPSDGGSTPGGDGGSTPGGDGGSTPGGDGGSTPGGDGGSTPGGGTTPCPGGSGGPKPKGSGLDPAFVLKVLDLITIYLKGAKVQVG